MKLRMRILSIFLLSPLTFGAQEPTTQPKETAKYATAEEILRSRTIWGKDFEVVLSQVSSWHSIGEQQLEVLPNLVVGKTSYSKKDVTGIASKFRQALHGKQSDSLQAIDSQLHNRPSILGGSEFGAVMRIERVMEVPSDHTQEGVRLQVASTISQPQFLNPDLNEADLVREFKPEKVSVEKPDLSDTKKFEGRPEIIKTYSYAGGAINFQTSNLSPYAPGKDGRLIQKVIIDASLISTALPPAAK